MKKTKLRWALSFMLTAYAFLSVSSAAHACIESENRKEAFETAPDIYINVDESTPALSDNVEVGSRFWELFFGETKKDVSKIHLVPGGDVFGIKIKQKNVTVTDAKGVPALKPGDIIISINGKSVTCADDVKRLISHSGGESITIRALHAGDEIGVEVRPQYEDGEYKLGISVRDGAAGIGTVTFIDPENYTFGGLGHGIIDGESGEIISMQSGEVCGVVLGGVHKGECGKPGELCGILTEEELGDLTSNNECGVFGILDSSDLDITAEDAISVATKSEVHEGEATIYSTIKNGKMAEYKIEIFDIDQSSTGSKSFRIRVTDETLKALTGGIVRGMSGSPIIQDGKLVGAVTHVMVANPTEGYGIFIENMLNASNARNELPRAA